MKDKSKTKLPNTYHQLFDDLKRDISIFDPVSFADNYLTLDSGERFNLSGRGWKYMADLWRYVGLQANNKKAKPIVEMKGRQVGATTKAGGIGLYFTASGLFGTEVGRPPMRVMHLFPSLKHVGQYTKEKLGPMIRNSVDGFITRRSLQNDKNAFGKIPEDTLSEKFFMGENILRVDSVGRDADRIRGTTQDVLLFDECFPYNQHIEVENGKMPIGRLYEMWKAGKTLPKVLSYNEEKSIFEYKDIVNAWHRGNKALIEIMCSKRKIKCTYNHRLLTDRGWVKAGDLQEGDLLKIKPSGSQYINSKWSKSNIEYGFHRVDAINDFHETDEVYDIEVRDNHNFILTSGRKGTALGGPIAHNCQDIPKKAIENAKKIAQHAKYGAKAAGLQLYFGTPKNSGTYFWKIWNASDQRFFQLACTSCEEYFFLYNLEDDSWNDIWIKEQEVRCPTCGFHQDKRDAVDGGRWVPTRLTKENVRVVDFNQNKEYVGFHHNLMLMPLFEKEDVQKSWPKYNPNADERAWKNETIGDFYRGGGMPLTMEDIISNALDETRGTSKTISTASGKTVVLGMDWGGIDDDDQVTGVTKGQSYTTAVILSVDTTGTFTIENAFKLKKNDLMYHVDVVDKLFKTYRVHQAVADLGYGQQTVRYMQIDMNYKQRFLGCYNSGNLNKQFSYDSKYMRVTVNKDQMLDELFEMVRQGKIKFPAQGLAWEQLHWLAEHCTSMETVTRIKNENIVKKYIKGAKPNDGLMALMYAVIAYKYLATGAFKAVKENYGTSQFPKPILSYAPGMN